jgi:hypothetical protein
MDQNGNPTPPQWMLGYSGGPGDPGHGLTNGKAPPMRNINGQLAAIIDGKPVVAQNLPAVTVTGHSHALDNSRDAANGPAAVDKSAFGFKTGHADDDHYPPFQMVCYCGSMGNWTDAVGPKFDPTGITIYETEDDIFALNLAFQYGNGFEAPEININTAADLNEQSQTQGVETKGNKEPNADGTQKYPQPAQSGGDPNRFTRKGAIYYDSNLHHNIRRDTDSTGELTDLPAKDTL